MLSTLMLSTMMRGSDPQDMADAEFHDGIGEAQLLEVFAQMKPIVELREVFAKARPIVLTFARAEAETTELKQSSA